MKLAALTLAGLVAMAGEVKLGQALTQKESLAVSKLVASAENHVGKTVQVKGKITEVCQMMGCWMNLVDPSTGESVRVKVNDGEIVFPKDSPGKMAIAEGTLKKIVLSKDQMIAAAQHEAEEQGRKFDPATVKSGKTIYQIQGTGAVLLD